MVSDLRISELLSGGVVIQGITGKQGRLETEWMLDSGTQIVAGVTPGKGGTAVCGIPVYNTVREAASHHQLTASMVYAPPQAVGDAADSALEAGVKLVCISAEGVPLHATMRLRETAAQRGSIVIGPNSQGLVLPGITRLGCPGGADPWDRFAPGPVAVVSRSGGLGSDLAYAIRTWGWGTSVQLHIGGSPTPATNLREAVLLAQAEPGTRVVVVLGEPTSGQELELAEAVASGDISVPVVVQIPGRFVDRLPAELPFGHAPRAGLGQAVSVVDKHAALEAGGARVARSFSDIHRLLTRSLEDRVQ